MRTVKISGSDPATNNRVNILLDNSFAKMPRYGAGIKTADHIALDCCLLSLKAGEKPVPISNVPIIRASPIRIGGGESRALDCPVDQI